MSFSKIYNEYGVDQYYSQIGSRYTNPHTEYINLSLKHDLDVSKKYLDLSSGDGVVSKFLVCQGITQVRGCDPYLHSSYEKNLKLRCYPYSFTDILNGKLKEKFDVIICSYALHLLPESYLPNFLYKLTEVGNRLIILSPHKKPNINFFWKLEKNLKFGKTHRRDYIKI
jgi:predicted nicotinamide N-methyase